MDKMSKYIIENGKKGEERLVLKNEKGVQIAAGKLLSADKLTRRSLRNISKDAADADIELQLKEGFEVKEGTKFEVFKEKDDKLNFRLRESGGNVLIEGNSYDNITDCLEAVDEARESLRDMSYSAELTAIHKMPAFTKKKAVPKFASMAEEIKQAENRSKDTGFSVIMSEKERPSFIMGRISDEKITSAKKAISALNCLHHTMGFENAEQEFSEDDVEIRQDISGTTFYRMKQYHKGIPVFAHTLVVSTDAEGNAESLSGQYLNISCDDTVKITEDEAKAIAERKYGEIISSEGLIYYVDDDDNTSLSWCINTEETKVYVSAVNGTILRTMPNLFTIDINTNRHITTLLNERDDISILNKDGGSPFSLYDGERKIEIYDDHNNTRTETAVEATSEGSTVLSDSQAVTAYNNIKKVYDYYRGVLGHKGADGKGKKIRIVMNYHEYTNRPNACFASGEKRFTKICLATRGGFERSLDVIGHEFTHAVDNAIWAPVYENQSGALDEAYADIMGEFVQDDTLDTHGENKTLRSPRKFDNGKTMRDYKSLGDKEKPGLANDQGYVHDNCQIMTHTAYLIQKKWLTVNRRNRYDLSALFFKSMQYLGQRSNFSDCFYALVRAALTMKVDVKYSYERQKNIGAIADAFLETGIFPNIISYTSAHKNIKVKGRVTDSNDGYAVPGVTVSAYLASGGKCTWSTVTNSNGEYEIWLRENENCIIKFSRCDGYMGEIKTGKITSKNCGPWNFVSKISNYITKSSFRICGHVMNPDTGRTVAGATVKIVKGKHTDSQVMTMKPEVELKTDANGYFCTYALPKGEYDVWAYSEISHSEYCRTSIAHVNNSTDPEYILNLTKKKRYYVTGFCIQAANTQSGAKDLVGAGKTLIDVDLNKGAGGAWIYMSYCVGNSVNPITNLLIYESNKKETWKTKTITHNGIKAVYSRLDIDLNKGAGGKYIYICSTRDKQFRPLTKLDVVVRGSGVVRAPYWSGVRSVKASDKSVDSYSDLNAGVRGSSDIYLMQTRKEIM